MIIYNVTTKVHDSIHQEWLAWLKEEHIPGMLKTGCFTHAHILRLLETDDAEGPTYAIQYHTDNIEMYDRYVEQYAGTMQGKSFEKWGDLFIAFRSVLEVVN